jgi:tetratricopeptide (TPR) repeat protein
MLIGALMLQSCTIAHFSVENMLNNPLPEHKQSSKVSYYVSVDGQMLQRTRTHPKYDPQRLEEMRTRYCKSTQEAFDREGLIATCTTNKENASFIVDIKATPFRSALPQEYLTGLSFGLIPSWGTRYDEYRYTFEEIGVKKAHSYYINTKSYNHLFLFPIFWIDFITMDESRVFRKTLHNYLTHAVESNNISAGTPDRADRPNIRQGLRWHQRGEYDKAISIFTSVLTINPTNVYALAGRGDSWAEKKEYTYALADYDRAILASPSMARLYYHRGVCWYEYAKRGKWYDGDKLPNAVADYTKAIALDPTNVAAYINRANINYMMGNFEQALDDYDKILKLTPNDKRAKAERAKTLKALQEKAQPQTRDEPPPQEI